MIKAGAVLKEDKLNKRAFRVFLAVAAAAAVLLAVYVFSGAPYHVYSDFPDPSDFLQLSSADDVVEQDFSLPSEAEGLSAVSVCFRTEGNNPRGTVSVSLFENGTPAGQWEYDARFLEDRSYRTFRLDKTLPASPESTYRIRISYTADSDAASDNGIYVGAGFSSGSESLEKNGTALSGQAICFRCIYTQSSVFQRLLLAVLLFLAVCIIGLLIVLYPNIRKNGCNAFNTRIVWTCAVILMCLFAFLYQHDDGVRITSWGKLFLDAVGNGSIRHYARYLEEVYEISNYNIVVHIMTAVFILPLYLVDKLLRLQLDAAFFDYWRKIILLFFLIRSADLMKKITVRLGFSEEAGNVLGILYLISPAVLWGNLGMGQIDCIAVYFILLFILQMLCGRPERAFFWLSVSFVIKAFPLLFIGLPCLAAALGAKRFKKILTCGASFILLPALSAVLSRTFFIDYAAYASLSEWDWGHIDRLFDVSMVHTSLFLLALLLVCFYCFYKARHSALTASDNILAPAAAAFAFLLFVEQNPQWILYTSLFLLLCALFFNRRSDLLWMLPVFVLGAFVYVLFRFQHNSDTIMLAMGWVGQTTELYNHSLTFYDFAQSWFPGYYTWFAYVGKTILCGCAAAAFVLFCRGAKHPEAIDREKFGGNHALAVVLPILFAMYFLVLISSVVMYFALIYV